MSSNSSSEFDSIHCNSSRRTSNRAGLPCKYQDSRFATDTVSFEQVSKHPSINIPIIIVGKKTDLARRLPYEEKEAMVCID